MMAQHNISATHCTKFSSSPNTHPSDDVITKSPLRDFAFLIGTWMMTFSLYGNLSCWPSCHCVCVCSHRCKGASHYGLSAERKRRSQEGDCTDSTSELTLAALPGEGCPSSAIALLSDEPGLVNPAYEPSVEDNSQSGSTTSLAARSGSRKSECECTQCICVYLFIS